MSHFKLTVLLLIIFILTTTAARAQNNSVANTGGNGNTNTNVNANTNANTNVNASVNAAANVNANTNAVADANTNTNSTKPPVPGRRLKIIFSGSDPNDISKVILRASDLEAPSRRFTFLANTPEIKTLLQTKFKEGDIVSVAYDEERDGVKILKDIILASETVNDLWRYGFPVLVFLLLIFLSYVLLRGKLKCLIVGEDNLYSKSKLQIAVWFFVLITTYISVFVIRYYYSDYNLIGGITIPSNLLLLSGLSALTFGAAKGLALANINKGFKKIDSTGNTPKFADFFQDDNGNVDLGDFQLIVITFLAVAIYIVQVFAFLEVVQLSRFVTLPDVDSALLTVVGLGHGSYLVKKAVGEGPMSRKSTTTTNPPPVKAETKTQTDVPPVQKDES